MASIAYANHERARAEERKEQALLAYQRRHPNASLADILAFLRAA